MRTAGARSSPFYLYCGDFFDTLRETADKLKLLADTKEVTSVFTSIAFYIREKVLGLNGREYPLGELTAEVLNISPEEYHELRRMLDKARDSMNRYEKDCRMQDWFDANEEMIRLHESLIQHRIFHLIQSGAEVLYEARTLTEQYSLFPEEDFVLGERDRSILGAIRDYEDYLEHPEDYGGEDILTLRWREERYTMTESRPPVPPAPPEKTRALLIVPGPLEEKWRYYKSYCENYGEILVDIMSVCQTLRAFVRMGLTPLEKLTPDNYVAALHTFLFHERAHKWIANPVDGTGFYTRMDDVRLHLIPRETAPDSGMFKVYEYYEADRLQTMLKLDFYKGLEAGHLIRRCENCGRFFLLQKGYHTKYCDLPNHTHPRYTCAQLGYRIRGVKEEAEDCPLAQALYRCFQRIDKDKSRGNITEKERELLREKAQELYHEARTKPGTSYDAFDASLSAGKLYPLCGVQRKSKPRGRPKRNT